MIFIKHDQKYSRRLEEIFFQTRVFKFVHSGAQVTYTSELHS